jgi:hypothetical protein
MPRESVSTGASAQVPVARAVGVGKALAVLRVPRFGTDWSWVAVEGTGLPQLAEGPGRRRRAGW